LRSHARNNNNLLAHDALLSPPHARTHARTHAPPCRAAGLERQVAEEERLSFRKDAVPLFVKIKGSMREG